MSDLFLWVDVIPAQGRYRALVQCELPSGDVSYQAEETFEGLAEALLGLDALIPSVAQAAWKDQHRIVGLARRSARATP